jgi:hypothetical protein
MSYRPSVKKWDLPGVRITNDPAGQLRAFGLSSDGVLGQEYRQVSEMLWVLDSTPTPNPQKRRRGKR